FFQALAGTWPVNGSITEARLNEDYADRMVEFMRKSAREAKVHTSWLHPEVAYEAALEEFVRQAIQRCAAASNGAAPAIIPKCATVGVVNSLAQVTLKIGSPGVADFYQGTELWDLTLVDPDNRRPVDFDARSRLLDDLEPLLGRVGSGDESAAADVLAL